MRGCIQLLRVALGEGVNTRRYVSRTDLLRYTAAHHGERGMPIREPIALDSVWRNLTPP
jgi:hypothetical protein